MTKRALIHLTTSVLFFLITLPGLSSCERNPQDKEPTLEDLIADARYNILEEKNYTVEEMADLLYGPEGVNADNNEIRRKFIEDSNKHRDDVDQIFAPEYKTYKYEYYSTDQSGNRIKLSAFMSVGAYALGLFFTDQDHIYLVCPYTHTRENECATKDNGGWEFTTFLSFDNMFIMPDGQGFGSDAGNVQPYVDHETQARQIYDALVAGYSLYNDEGGKMESSWTLRVVGASQGGGDAMAVHKLLDTTPFDPRYPLLLKYLWCFEYSYVCCGPYSPEATMQAYHDEGVVHYPCVVPLVIKSMLAANPDLAEKYGGEAAFYSRTWNGNNNKTMFDRIYREKTMNSEDLNKLICEKLGVSTKGDDVSVPLSLMLSEKMMDSDSDMYKDLMECLRKQELTSGWTPITPTKIFFSPKDDVVPYVNTEKLFKLFGNKCIYKYETRNKHVDTCQEFILSSW